MFENLNITESLKESTILQEDESQGKGKNSRMKKVLIQEAIKRCKPEDKFNTYAICEQLAELMVNRYKKKNLEYHSERMGMETTLKMIKEIENYFFRDYK